MVERSRAAWVQFFATRVAGMTVDTAVMAAAYGAAFAMRFDFREPSWGWAGVAASFITVWGVQLGSLLATGCWALAWRRIRALDLPRYLGAVALSGAALTALRFAIPSPEMQHVRPPYSVTVINMVLWAIGLTGVRFLWRLHTEGRGDVKGLLAREETAPGSAAVLEMVHGRCVMVTGAGGSIGSELVRQIVRCGPRKVVLVERGENALYEIDRELRQTGTETECRAEMADIADEARMREIFAEHRPEMVLHAAAYKHVPMVEANPRDGLKNNTLATRRLGEWAREAGVERFVMISTDKAVNPVGIMGITKRLAEILLMDLNGGEGATRFVAVRFGNVLGSSGSVAPLFKEQIGRRGPVTVTHPEMRRYFMTIQEAVGLTLQAAALARGGETFVLDMGEPVKILDLAERMIRQAGYRPYVDIPIRFTGVRPGEKMFEELDVSGKSAIGTEHARIFKCRERETPPPARLLEELERLAAGKNAEVADGLRRIAVKL